MHIRRATLDDADAFAALLGDYLAEKTPDHPGCTADVLRRDVLSGDAGQQVIVGERDGRIVAFAA